MAQARRSTGTVQWFSGHADGGGDLFVHQTEIQSEGFRTLREGQSVEFSVDNSEDGRSKAVGVVVLAKNDDSGVRRGGGYGGRGSGRGWRFGGGDGVECYNCGRTGHLARDCYTDGGGDGGFGYFARGGRGRGGGGGGECFSCGEKGHFARDCPIDHTFE